MSSKLVPQIKQVEFRTQRENRRVLEISFNKDTTCQVRDMGLEK